MATQPTWSISRFYNSAWDLTKKHKELWIMGLLVAFLAGGSGGNNWSNVFNSDSNDSQKEARAQESAEDLYLIQDPETNSIVIKKEGAAEDVAYPVEYPTNPANLPESALLESPEFGWMNDFMRAFEMNNPFTRVPAWAYVLGGVSLVIFIVQIVVLSLVLVGWSKASLIKGVAEAVARPDRPVDLAAVSRFGLTRARPMIWVQIVPVLMFVAVTAILAIIAALLTSTVSNSVSESSPIPIVLIFTWICLGVYAAVRFAKLAMALVWAERHVVLDEMPGRVALKAGYATAKGNYLKTLLVGFVNMIMGAIVFFGALIMSIILVVIGIIPMALNKNLMVVSIPYLTILIIIMIGLYMAYMAASQVFFHAVWQYAFDTIKKRSSR